MLLNKLLAEIHFQKNLQKPVQLIHLWWVLQPCSKTTTPFSTNQHNSGRLPYKAVTQDPNCIPNQTGTNLSAGSWVPLMPEHLQQWRSMNICCRSCQSSRFSKVLFSELVLSGFGLVSSFLGRFMVLLLDSQQILTTDMSKLHVQLGS